MTIRSVQVLCLFSAVLLALWLLFAAADRVLGIDSGSAGFSLLVAAAWGGLYVLYRTPRGELESTIAPGEWRAWIGVVFMLQLTLYLLLKSQVFSGDALLGNPAAAAVGRNVGLLFVAWIVVSSVMNHRLKGQVQEDERDRQIAGMSSSWGRYALVFGVAGVAVMLGFSPAEKLAWARPVTLAHLLVFTVLWGSLVEYVVSAILYWRDRH